MNVASELLDDSFKEIVIQNAPSRRLAATKTRQHHSHSINLRILSKTVAHFKSICKTYKKQLDEANQNIRELHHTIEQMEKSNYFKRRNSLQKELDKDTDKTIHSCSLYCESQQRTMKQIQDELAKISGHSLLVKSSTREEFIFNSLNEIKSEKREIESFKQRFKSLMSQLDHKQLPKYDIDMKTVNTMIDEYLESRNKKSSDSSNHTPSVEFSLDCLRLFQKLFDVNCYLNVPTRMNEIYYKQAELNWLKKSLHNTLDPKRKMSSEKLVESVQGLQKQLNVKLSITLRQIFKTNDLKLIVEKCRLYDECFPPFCKLIQQVLKELEIHRLEDIVPSLRTLKLLSSPSNFN